MPLRARAGWGRAPIALLAAAALLISACGGSDDTASPATTSAHPTTTTSSTKSSPTTSTTSNTSTRSSTTTSSTETSTTTSTTSDLLAEFDAAVRKTLEKQGLAQSRINCVIDKLNKSVSEADIEAVASSGEVPDSVSEAAFNAALKCPG